MRIEDLPGQYVWVKEGTPLLHRPPDAPPKTMVRPVIVRIERIQGPAGALPALAIWHDAEGDHGVDASLVSSQVMSLPPSGRSWLTRAGGRVRGLFGGRNS